MFCCWIQQTLWFLTFYKQGISLPIEWVVWNSTQVGQCIYIKERFKLGEGVHAEIEFYICYQRSQEICTVLFFIQFSYIFCIFLIFMNFLYGKGTQISKFCILRGMHNFAFFHFILIQIFVLWIEELQVLF